MGGGDVVLADPSLRRPSLHRGCLGCVGGQGGEEAFGGVGR